MKFVVRKVIEHNEECLDKLRVVDMNEKVNDHWGFDGIFKLTEKDIEALRQRKALYNFGDEYAHIIFMEVDND